MAGNLGQGAEKEKENTNNRTNVQQFNFKHESKIKASSLFVFFCGPCCNLARYARANDVFYTLRLLTRPLTSKQPANNQADDPQPAADGSGY